MTPEDARKIVKAGRGEYWIVSDNPVDPKILHIRAAYSDPAWVLMLYSDKAPANQDPWMEISRWAPEFFLLNCLLRDEVFASEKEARAEIVHLLHNRVQAAQYDLIRMRASLRQNSKILRDLR